MEYACKCSHAVDGGIVNNFPSLVYYIYTVVIICEIVVHYQVHALCVYIYFPVAD